MEITSVPTGARVEIDGVARGTTPLELRDLAAGRHEYRVSLRGYRVQTGSFTITNLTGTIVVSTEPAGAQVFLDGTQMGQAVEGGLPLSRVPYGRHSVKAQLEGYNDVTKIVDLKTPGPYAVTLRLGWGKGFLSVRSEPDSARLAVESKPVGATPYFAELAPNRYVLTLVKRGYADWIGYAEVYQAETANVRVTLEKLKTRKLPFLIAGAVGIVAGGASAYMGEQSYAQYQDATSADSARHYRQATERWDLMRNVALGGGAALSVTWLLVRW
ncbi:MAG: PEGA domain-containing protein [bacterium]